METYDLPNVLGRLVNEMIKVVTSIITGSREFGKSYDGMVTGNYRGT